MDSSSNNSNSSNNDHIIITMNKSTSSDNIVDSNDRNNSIMSPAEIEPNSGSSKRAAEATATLYRVAARNLRESQGVNSMTAPMLEKIMTLLQLEPRRLVVRGLAPRRLLLGASPAPLPTMEDSPDVEENERYEERGMFEDDIENDTSEAEQIDADEQEKEDASGDGNDDTLEKEDETQEEPKPKPKPESRRPIHAALVTGGIKLRPRETKALLRALDVSPHRFVRLGLVDGKALRAVDGIGGPSQGPPHGPHHLRPGHPPGMCKHGHGSRFGRNIGHSGPPPHGRHHSGHHIHLPSSDGEGGHGRPMHCPPRHHDPPRGRHGGGRRRHSGPPPHGRHHSGHHIHLPSSDSEGGHGSPMHEHDPPLHVTMVRLAVGTAAAGGGTLGPRLTVGTTPAVTCTIPAAIMRASTAGRCTALHATMVRLAIGTAAAGGGTLGPRLTVGTTPAVTCTSPAAILRGSAAGQCTALHATMVRLAVGTAAAGGGTLGPRLTIGTTPAVACTSPAAVLRGSAAGQCTALHATMVRLAVGTAAAGEGSTLGPRLTVGTIPAVTCTCPAATVREIAAGQCTALHATMTRLAVGTMAPGGESTLFPRLTIGTTPAVICTCETEPGRGGTGGRRTCATVAVVREWEPIVGVSSNISSSWRLTERMRRAR